jgi:hypothetical protein
LIDLMHPPFRIAVFPLPVYCKPRFLIAQELITANAYFFTDGFKVLDGGPFGRCPQGKPAAHLIGHTVESCCKRLALLLQTHNAVEAQRAVQKVVVGVIDFTPRARIRAVAAAEGNALRLSLRQDHLHRGRLMRGRIRVDMDNSGTELGQILQLRLKGEQLIPLIRIARLERRESSYQRLIIAAEPFNA